MLWNQIRRLGTGCGIEIRAGDLRVIAVKSRPKGVTVLGHTVIRDFRDRPAKEWGDEYAEFLKRVGISHLAATVGLPRSQVIVRQVDLPAMPKKQLPAAVAYQLEGLHPYADDEIYHAFFPFAERAGRLTVGVLIAERATVDKYAGLFESAGIAVSAFTVTSAAFYAGLRVRWDAPPAPFLIADLHSGRLEVYGEAPARPFFSAEFDLASLPANRALELSSAELRLAEGQSAHFGLCGDVDDHDDLASVVEAQESDRQPGLETQPLAEMLPSPLHGPGDLDLRREAAAYAVALESACPRLGWRANVLPPDRRKTDSRWMYAPTAALAALLLLLALAFALRPVIQDRQYLQALEAEEARLSSLVSQVEETQSISRSDRERLQLLRSLENRTQADLEILSELSTLIPNAVWLTSLELNDQGVQIAGEGQAEAAPSLLGLLGESRLLSNAAFSSSLVKTNSGERFQIVAERRNPAEDGESPDDPPHRAATQRSTPEQQPEQRAATLSTVAESGAAPEENP